MRCLEDRRGHVTTCTTNPEISNLLQPKLQISHSEADIDSTQSSVMPAFQIPSRAASRSMRCCTKVVWAAPTSVEFFAFAPCFELWMRKQHRVSGLAPEPARNWRGKTHVAASNTISGFPYKASVKRAVRKRKRRQRSTGTPK
jgi:hypothetical protein